jgi:hypothetical protein
MTPGKGICTFCRPKKGLSRAKFGKNRKGVILWTNGRSMQAEDDTRKSGEDAGNMKGISSAAMAQYRKEWRDMCRRSI